jgi:hypothetical protein
MQRLSLKLAVVLGLGLCSLASACSTTQLPGAALDEAAAAAADQEARPALYKSVTDWALAEDLYFDYLGAIGGDGDISQIETDPELNWEARHQAMQSGLNQLDVQRLLNWGGSIAPETFFDGFMKVGDDMLFPVYIDGLKLVSSESKLSFVTYGLKEFPGQQKALRLSIDAIPGPEGESGQAGLYIGISNVVRESWQWYGPFKSDELENIDISRTPSVNAFDRSYITLLCAGGDSYGIKGLSVEVGNLEP